ncbi:hypothetical protein [Arcticibacter tournemirensis]
MMNLIKEYDALLDLTGMSEPQAKVSLRRIFDRDIQNNENFKFQEKVIRPIKIDGQASLDTLFGHLTTTRVWVEENSLKFQRSLFDAHRSIRLHWVKFHIDRGAHDEVQIFSVEERDLVKRKDVINTYIYNIDKKYVVVLRPQNSDQDYYLLTAYYLYEKWGAKEMSKKIRHKLDKVY